MNKVDILSPPPYVVNKYLVWNKV